MAEPSIKRLGTFLADLTQDKPPDQIHQEIIARLRDPVLDLDHRLAGIYLHVKDFVPVWTAIRNGVSLPGSSWETVVLPAVVHYSLPQMVKANLETATNLWLTARGARVIESSDQPEKDMPLVRDPVALEQPPSLLDELLEPSTPPWPTPSPSPAPPARRRRRWVPQAAAIAIVAIAAALVWTSGSSNGSKVSTLPQVPGAPSRPSAEPSASPSESPAPSSSASPYPHPSTTSGPPRPIPTRTTGGPPRPLPGAPTHLKVDAVGMDWVKLSWQAPMNSVEIAGYKIHANDRLPVLTPDTTDQVLGLTPGTAYTFTVTAYTKDGLESAPSNAVRQKTYDPPTMSTPSSVAFGGSLTITIVKTV